MSRGRGAEPQELWFICAVAKATKEKENAENLLTSPQICGIMNTVKRGRELKNNAKTQKEKNLKNPLDKPHKVWYNKYVIKGESFPLK